MGFKGNRIWIIIIAVAFIAALIIGVSSASSGTSKTKKPAGLLTCTVNGDVGLDQIVIINQNTGKSIIKTTANLPYTFNLTEGDTLRFNVTLIEGYNWNAWEINQYPWFAQDNPFTMKVNADLVLYPQTIAR